MHETGNRDIKGASGEIGRAQWLPSTYKMMSTKYIGYVTELTETNEVYILSSWVEEMMNKGYNDYQIAIRHNRPDGKEVKGINKFGVKYDSGAYATSVMAILK